MTIHILYLKDHGGHKKGKEYNVARKHAVNLIRSKIAIPYTEAMDAEIKAKAEKKAAAKVKAAEKAKKEAMLKKKTVKKETTVSRMFSKREKTIK